MIELPTAPHKGDRELIKSMIILSRPKMGKTRALMTIPNSILIDLEDSSDFFDGVSINVLKEAKEQSKETRVSPISVMKQISEKIKVENTKKGAYVYDYGIIDTVNRLEKYCERYATHLYKNTPQGSTYNGKDVLADLEYGAGYLYLRRAMNEVLDPFFGLFKTLILVGHVKDSSINIKGKTLGVTDIDLTGKIKSIITGKCDAIGTMYRDKDKADTNILSFVTNSTDVVTGARPAHLSGREFVISELNRETDKLTTHWKKIFTSI